MTNIVSNSFSRDNTFLVAGNGVSFGPYYMPDRISVSKERNLVRHANFCGLEDVFEVHGHNREIHISGRLTETELSRFNALLDHNRPTNLYSRSWSGEVRVMKGEYEGPMGIDPDVSELVWTYSLDLLSTGESEAGHLKYYNDGVVDEGSA